MINGSLLCCSEFLQGCSLCCSSLCCLLKLSVSGLCSIDQFCLLGRCSLLEVLMLPFQLLEGKLSFAELGFLRLRAALLLCQGSL